MINEYDQLKQKDTNYACSIYALLNLFKYDYWIFIELTKTLKFLIILEKAWVFFRLQWAYAKYIFPAAIKHINKVFWLKLYLWVTTLNHTLSNKYWYILWYKRANTSYIKTTNDWEVTKDDIDIVLKTKQNWHFHYRKRWKIVESLWGFRYKLNKNHLKYAYSKWLYYKNIRYIYWEEELKEEFIKIVKLKRRRNLENPYIKYDEILRIKEQFKYKNYD